jgi:LysR family glycine cleavage system transcriptional activator
MVAALERDLKVQLFHRRGKQLELTSAGQAYFVHVSEALDRIDMATRSAQSQDGGRVLSISAIPTLALRWLVPRLRGFEDANPNILVDVKIADKVDFGVTRTDVEFRYGSGKWAGGEATLLMHEDVGVFCAPSLLRSGPPLRGPSDLLQNRLIQHTTRPTAWTDYFESQGLQLAATAGTPGFEHFFMVFEAAAAGMGLALLPVFLARDDVEKGRLVQAFPQTTRNRNAYYLVHAKGTGHLLKIRLFKKWAVAQARSTQKTIPIVMSN